jgi:hypothetical protein
VLYKTHATVARPALLVVITHDILVVWVRFSTEVALDKVPRLLRSEAKEHVDLIDVAGVKSDRMPRFSGRVLELQEVIGHRRRTGHLARSLQAKNEQV